MSNVKCRPDSLWFDHHSADDQAFILTRQLTPTMIWQTCEADTAAAAEPPTTAKVRRAVGLALLIVVDVVRREVHPVVVHQCVAGVSAVAGHVQTIQVGFVCDAERPVLGRVPLVCRLPLHLDPQLGCSWIFSWATPRSSAGMQLDLQLGFTSILSWAVAGSSAGLHLDPLLGCSWIISWPSPRSSAQI